MKMTMIIIKLKLDSYIDSYTKINVDDIDDTHHYKGE